MSRKMFTFRNGETVCLAVSNYLNGNLRLTLCYPDGSYCEELTVYTDEELDANVGYVKTYEIPEAMSFIVNNKLGKRIKNNTLIIDKCASLLYDFNSSSLKENDPSGYDTAMQFYKKKRGIRIGS